MKKIAVFFASGHEEVEALTVVDLLRRANFTCHMISVTGERIVTSSHNISLFTDYLFEDVDFSDYDGFVLPGGIPGTPNLAAHEGLRKLLEEANAQGKLLAAICAAPTVYGKMGLLEGKKACCYPDMEGDLLGARVSYDTVSVDGNFITSRGLGTAIDFGLAIISYFDQSEDAQALAKKIVYR